ncbi:hypothetical protein CEXT_517311 [Caerostris extrusa]|uniref:Uncharacterized protein n=1 Tax=Caerostris extrusa TaxID=172846 RepID=A0AAV4MG61_CAEEX|nr:hypothetical protein CEXT_517311 [Caerostris extrusa]
MAIYYHSILWTAALVDINKNNPQISSVAGGCQSLSSSYFDKTALSGLSVTKQTCMAFMQTRKTLFESRTQSRHYGEEVLQGTLLVNLAHSIHP